MNITLESQVVKSPQINTQLNTQINTKLSTQLNTKVNSKMDSNKTFNIINTYFLEENKINPYCYGTYLLAFFCMPTLMMLKPATLFQINKKRIHNYEEVLSIIDQEIQQFNSKYIVLFEDEALMAIFVYNQELLLEVIECKENRTFLRQFRYEYNERNLTDIFAKLKGRYEYYMAQRGEVAAKEVYPHEIGVLLGYPVNDVKDFITFRGSNYQVCGTWKVYHNKDAALKLFERYRALREKALNELSEGKKLQDMIFSV